MTDETKKIFAAPWTVYGEPDDYSFVIQNASEDDIATVFMTDEAKRIRHLPELYDALVEAANRLCGEPRYRGQYACKSCVVKDSCQVRKWYELLEKVRGGEQ